MKCCILFGVVLTFSGIALAQANCPDKFETHGNVSVQQTSSGDGSACFLSIHGTNDSNMIYRDYLVATDGSFMVFNSYGSGDDASTTGARQFYLFPHVNPTLSYTWNDTTGILEVVDATGGHMQFAYADGQIVKMDKAQLKIDAPVLKTNAGGVEINHYQGLMLDTGFEMGHSALDNKTGPSTFTDLKGQKCTVKNNEIFVYDSDGNATLKYDDAAMNKFLKTRCSNLTGI